MGRRRGDPGSVARVVRPYAGGLCLQHDPDVVDDPRCEGPQQSVLTPSGRTDGIWDALAAPATIGPRAPRALVLGYGGGTVGRLLRQLQPGAHVTGVDFDPAAWDVSGRWDTLPDVRVRADAVEYVETYRGPGFDYVLEDLFVGVRKPSLNRARLADLTRGAGLIVVNHAGGRSARRTVAALRGVVDHAVTLRVGGLANHVVIARRVPIDPEELAARIGARFPELAQRSLTIAPA